MLNNQITQVVNLENLENLENKIDFDELISDFRIYDKDVFTSYLTEIWIDLRSRSDEKDLGVSKTTFFRVFFSCNILVLHSSWNNF